MKKLSNISKIMLFLTSYIPFYLMYWVIDFKEINKTFPFIHFNSILSWVFLLFSASLFYLFYMLKYFNNTTDKISVKIISITTIDKEITSYLVTYILPLLSFDQGRNIVLLLILMAFICVLYIKTDMFAINPILMLLGYHITEMEFQNDNWKNFKSGVFITKKTVHELMNIKRESRNVSITQINGDMYMIMEVNK